MKRLWMIAGAGCALAGCAGEMSGGDAPIDPARSYSAVIRDAAGAEKGTARATMTGGAVRISVEANGMPPGAHGLHVHAVGLCDGPKFETAGSHWNPDMKQHGAENPMGAHRGDVPNLMIGTDGRGSLSFDLAGGSGMLLDSDGSSIVVHASADDYRTDPSGNSGGRIACGVFG